MATLNLVLVLSFFGGISGQLIYFDIGGSIEMSTNFAASTNISSVSATNRMICYNNNGHVYYNIGDEHVRDINGSIFFSAPSGTTINSLACCCDTIAITFNDNPGNALYIWFVNLADPYPGVIIIKVWDYSCTELAIIKCFPTLGKFVVVTRSKILYFFFYDLMTKYEILFAANYHLTFTPRCVACAANNFTDTTGGFDIFVSFEATNNIAGISYDGTSSTVTHNNMLISVSGSARYAYCVSASSSVLYGLLTEGGTENWEIRYFTFANVLTMDSNDGTNTALSGTNAALGPTTVNGLQVCDDNCQAINCSVTCGCSTTCGVCAVNNTMCQCENSIDINCCYTDAGRKADCEDCIPPINACVMVYNPIALRRSGPSIKVVGVTTEDSLVELTRYVTTGRYNAPNLPINTPITGVGGGLFGAGFSAAVPGTGRGRRFGVYAARFSPSGISTFDPFTIPSIVTENSGFFNRLYCYTTGHLESVYLVATLTPPLDQFKNTLRWRFTKVDQITGPESTSSVPACTFTSGDKHTCHLTSLTKADNEGVYEVYRPGRRLRLWHPMFFLFVRQCESGKFGTGCQGDCPDCEYGECDSDCGTCECYPGWMGTLCDEACGDGNTVGKSCDIECTDVFPDSTMCRGILLFRPPKVPCACRSGLEPPYCLNDCATNTWGPNCRKTCSGCDPRTGP